MRHTPLTKADILGVSTVRDILNITTAVWILKFAATECRESRII